VIYRLDCDSCGELEYIEQDGYAVGDRLLEDVWFKCFKDGHVEIRDDCAGYFSQLNRKMWIRRMVEFFDGDDVARCHKCGADAGIFHSEDEWLDYLSTFSQVSGD